MSDRVRQSNLYESPFRYESPTKYERPNTYFVQVCVKDCHIYCQCFLNFQTFLEVSCFSKTEHKEKFNEYHVRWHFQGLGLWGSNDQRTWKHTQKYQHLWKSTPIGALKQKTCHSMQKTRSRGNGNDALFVVRLTGKYQRQYLQAFDFLVHVG